MTKPHIVKARRTKLDKARANVTVVIPAAGIGRGFRSMGSRSMILMPDGSRLIEKQIATIRTVFPHAEIVVVIGFDSERVFKTVKDTEGVFFVENENFEETNIARSISLALRVLRKKNVLIVSGDLVFNEQAISCFNLEESSTLAIKGTERDIGINMSDDMYIEELRFGVEPAWSQITFIHENDLEVLKRIVYHRKNDKALALEVINKMIKNRVKFKVLDCSEAKVLEIDSSKDIGELLK